MDKILGIFATAWTTLFHLVESLLKGLSAMSLQDLLTWMLVLTVIMIVALGFLNAAASVVNHSLSILRKLFRYFAAIVAILLIVFWVFASERPCMFNAESGVTSCLTKPEWEKRQQELAQQQKK